MIFLIEYDRLQGYIVNFTTFKDSERFKAQDRRLKVELSLNRRGINHEVVLLEAAKEEMLRRTHRRYFENLRQIAESVETAGGFKKNKKSRL